jgi:hypothetical protein
MAMNIFFVNDSSSNPNWGDRAAAFTLKKMISELGGIITVSLTEEDLRESHFSMEKKEEKINNKYSGRLHLFIPPIGYKIKDRLLSNAKHTNHQLIPEIIEEFDRFVKLVFANAKQYSLILEGIQKTDLIIIHGNGAMRFNDAIPRSMLFITYLAKKYFNKPVIMINHSVDIRHPELYRIVRAVYPLFNDVVFRDTISAENHKDMGKSRFAPDTGFIMKPLKFNSWLPFVKRSEYFSVWPDSAVFNPAEPYICVGGSSIYNKRTAGEYEIVHGFIQLLQYLRNIYKGQIVLTASDRVDEIYFRVISKQYGYPLVGLNIPIQQAIDILGNADAYIGGRWHSSIFSLRGGVPVVPISANTYKMDAIMRMAGICSRSFNALDLEHAKDKIGMMLLRHLDSGSELRHRLSTWAEMQCEKSWDNLNYLKQLIS